MPARDDSASRRAVETPDHRGRPAVRQRDTGTPNLSSGKAAKEIPLANDERDCGNADAHRRPGPRAPADQPAESRRVVPRHGHDAVFRHRQVARHQPHGRERGERVAAVEEGIAPGVESRGGVAWCRRQPVIDPPRPNAALQADGVTNRGAQSQRAAKHRLMCVPVPASARLRVPRRNFLDERRQICGYGWWLIDRTRERLFHSRKTRERIERFQARRGGHEAVIEIGARFGGRRENPVGGEPAIVLSFGAGDRLQGILRGEAPGARGASWHALGAAARRRRARQVQRRRPLRAGFQQ